MSAHPVAQTFQLWSEKLPGFSGKLWHFSHLDERQHDQKKLFYHSDIRLPSLENSQKTGVYFYLIKKLVKIIKNIL